MAQERGFQDAKTRLNLFLQRLRMGSTALLIFEPQYYNELLAETVKQLSEGGGRGVVVTLERSWRRLKEALEDGGVDTDQIYFIDGVSALTGEKGDSGEGFVVLDQGPRSLTDLSVELSRAPREGDPFVVLASLSTLAEYHDRGPVFSFTHQTSARLQRQGLTYVQTCLSGQHREIVNAVVPVCDDVLDLGKSQVDRAVEEYFFG